MTSVVQDAASSPILTAVGMGNDVMLLDERFAKNEKEASLMDAYDEEFRKDWREIGELMQVPNSPNSYIPRNGFLGLKSAVTPMHLYNHPALMEISNTAFTDGIHVFVSLEFYKALNKSVNDSGGKLYGIEILLKHELMHMALHHTERLLQFPKDIANDAEDKLINSKQILAFPEELVCDLMKRMGMGMRAGEAEKWASMSEETIARMLWNERNKKKNDSNAGAGGKGGAQGSPVSGQPSSGSGKGKGGGQGSPNSGQPSSGSGKGKGKPSPGSPGQGEPGGGEEGSAQQDGEKQPTDSAGNPWDDNHTITPEDLIKIMNKNNLGHVLDKLEYPRDADPEKVGKMQEKILQQDLQNVQIAMQDRALHGDKYPGGPILDYVAETIMNFKRGKLGWKLGMKEFVMDEGMKSQPSDDFPDELFFVEEVEEMLGFAPYLASSVPHRPREVVAIIIDTSGSMSEDDMRAACEESLELADAANGGDSATEVLIFSADTSVRGDPLIINRNNYEEFLAGGLRLHGRGGTDFVEPMMQVIASKEVKEKKVRSIVYITDTHGRAPTKEQLPKHIKYCWIATPSTSGPDVESFAREVSAYSRVYVIEQGVQVDLSETALNIPINPTARPGMKSSNKKKGVV